MTGFTERAQRVKDKMAASNESTRLTSIASRVLGEWYFINGVPASLEDAEVLTARGLPRGDYSVANDFVCKLRTITEIKARHHITVH
jgi:hypothetical protein